MDGTTILSRIDRISDDLLGQCRARRAARLDPDAAQERPPEVVQRYQQ